MYVVSVTLNFESITEFLGGSLVGVADAIPPFILLSIEKADPPLRAFSPFVRIALVNGCHVVASRGLDLVYDYLTHLGLVVHQRAVIVVQAYVPHRGQLDDGCEFIATDCVRLVPPGP